MSATDTAERVIDWALCGDGPPPRGDARDADRLAHPSTSLADAVGRLARVAAARLRLAAPPLGDRGPVGAGVAVLAAALGVAHAPDLAGVLLKAVPASPGLADRVARHGLAARVLGYLPAGLADDLRLASPLTALLDRPLRQQQAECVELAHAMIGRPGGRVALQTSLARPTRVADVLRWRQDLMERLLLQGGPGREFVLDVYELTMTQHEAEALECVRDAGAVFRDEAALADDRLNDGARAAAGWWRPLAALDRTDRESLRARRYLGYRYREGIALARLAEKMTGATR